MPAFILSDLSHKTLFESASRILFQFLETSKEENLNIALPGGRSVKGLLDAMRADLALLSPETRRRLHFFMVDERLVPLEDEESNFRLLKQGLFDELLKQQVIKESQLHPFRIPGALDDASLSNAVSNYASELLNVGGVLHAVVLSAGEDGHVASLFPAHHSISDPAPYFISFNDSPKPPPGRLSASAALLRQAQFGMALFIGAGKNEALRRYLSPELELEDCPAKIVDFAAHSTVVTDIVVADLVRAQGHK